jgi:hypothetical protein
MYKFKQSQHYNISLQPRISKIESLGLFKLPSNMQVLHNVNVFNYVHIFNYLQ